MYLNIDILTNEDLRELLPEPDLRKRYLVYVPGLRHILRILADKYANEEYK